jgi:uncharacterized protein (DUF1330 family)
VHHAARRRGGAAARGAVAWPCVAAAEGQNLVVEQRWADNQLCRRASPSWSCAKKRPVVGIAAQASYVPHILAAIKDAGGHSFNTAGGKIVAIVGEAPKRVPINEWDSLEQAQAFYNSKAWKDLAPQREKAQKLTRLYAVEVLK